jgi:hypothetical protein
VVQRRPLRYSRNNSRKSFWFPRWKLKKCRLYRKNLSWTASYTLFILPGAATIIPIISSPRYSSHIYFFFDYTLFIHPGVPYCVVFIWRNRIIYFFLSQDVSFVPLRLSIVGYIARKWRLIHIWMRYYELMKNIYIMQICVLFVASDQECSGFFLSYGNCQSWRFQCHLSN